MTDVQVEEVDVSLYLGRREYFSPNATNAAKEVVQAPVVRVISPFADRVHCFQVFYFFFVCSSRVEVFRGREMMFVPFNL